MNRMITHNLSSLYLGVCTVDTYEKLTIRQGSFVYDLLLLQVTPYIV
jgi:hypothetical protein